MSKELEALYRLVKERLANDDGKTHQTINIDISVSAMKEVIQALTPPTADEVCEALSEYLDTNVEYHNRFGFICNDRVIICLYPNNVLSFNNNYPAYIHNIVGKFYEKESEKK